MNETKDISEIRTFIEGLLRSHCPPLLIRKEGELGLEAAGTKEAMQGKQKVDGYYFASTVQKPKDLRFYFFALYTDPELFSISEELSKMLKGKTCFHLKKLNDALKQEISEIVLIAVKRYQEKDLI
jgi:hypothetical protein